MFSAAFETTVTTDPLAAEALATASTMTDGTGPTPIKTSTTDLAMSQLAVLEPIDDRLLLVPGNALASRVADWVDLLAASATENDKHENNHDGDHDLLGKEDINTDALDQLFASWHDQR